MKSNLENFKPKLRPGRVIPRGSQIIFETDNPYNQILLPMALADLILLCGGQFTVRQIIEKIYRKQKTVPFKWILFTLHSLHQGGFFENGEDLVLSPQLQSWVAPKAGVWHLSWRFGQRIESSGPSLVAYYSVTLVVLILSLLGLQFFPGSPFKSLESWMAETSLSLTLITLFVMSSAIQTLRHLLHGAQLLLLTGKVYNVSLRLSPWGAHLHVGDESNSQSENRLYNVMFHLSQILFPWALVMISANGLAPHLHQTLILMSIGVTIWELNPFADSCGRKLIRALVIESQRDMATWHFSNSLVLSAYDPGLREQETDVSRLFRVWSALWLLLALVALTETANVIGPHMATRLARWDETSWPAALGFGLWLTGLYFLVDAILNHVLIPTVAPIWHWLIGRFERLTSSPADRWPAPTIRDCLEKLPLFSHFSERYLNTLIQKSELVPVRSKFDIIRQGHLSRDVFVLLEGQVEIFRHDGQDRWITEMNAVSIFGEAALVDNSPRGANVRAKTECVVLKIPVAQIRQVAEESHAVRHLDDFRDAILVSQFFASSPVFRSLSNESVEFLSHRGKLEIYNFDQHVIEQGDIENNMYLILRGAVDIIVHGQKVKSIKQGNFFGEIAMLANVPRTATVKTSEPCVFFKISADSFWEVLVNYMDLGIFLESISEARLKEDLQATKPLSKTGSDSN